MEEFLFPYTAADLTTEVNRFPNEFGLLNALNIAPFESKRAPLVRIEMRNGVIHVLSDEPRGAPGEQTPADSENGVILEIPHFPHIESIKVGDIDGLLEVVNGQVAPRSLDAELARKLRKIRTNHAITLEFIRIGMLRGVIKDGKGRTLHDLYDVFGITKKSVDFSLGTEGTNVMDKCEEVVDHIGNHLQGEMMSGVETIVSTEFFGKLIKHPNVEKFWIAAQNDAYHQQLRRETGGGNWGRVFVFGDVIFREYKGSLPVKNASGGVESARNVAANFGHAYPAGTMEMMRTFECPAHHIAMVNDAPTEDMVFVSPKELDHGEGYELKSQSNRLAVCKQPDCLVEIKTSN